MVSVFFFKAALRPIGVGREAQRLPGKQRSGQSRLLVAGSWPPPSGKAVAAERGLAAERALRHLLWPSVAQARLNHDDK